MSRIYLKKVSNNINLLSKFLLMGMIVKCIIVYRKLRKDNECYG